MFSLGPLHSVNTTLVFTVSCALCIYCKRDVRVGTDLRRNPWKGKIRKNNGETATGAVLVTYLSGGLLRPLSVCNPHVGCQ